MIKHHNVNLSQENMGSQLKLWKTTLIPKVQTLVALTETEPGITLSVKMLTVLLQCLVSCY